MPRYATKPTVMLVAAITALAACAPSPPSSSGSSAGSGGGKTSITIATTTDVLNYNPLLGVSFSDYWISDLMYPTLMTMDGSGTKQPSVATKWGYTSPTKAFFELRSDF